MKPTHLLPCLLASFLLPAGFLPAQTATWIGQGNLATYGDWNNPANWDSGSVPSGSSHAAVITQATPAIRNFPNGPYINHPSLPVASVIGGALPVITGALTLGQLRFDVVRADSPYTSAVYIGWPGGGTPGSLLLDGAGLSAAPQGSSPVDVNVTAGSALTFSNRGALSAGGSATLTVYLGESTGSLADPARLTFLDDTAIATFTRRITVRGSGPASIVFADRARAGNGNLMLAQDSTVAFHNTASADAAQITLRNRSLLLFDGQSTAANSAITIAGSGSPVDSTVVRFAGASTAAQSTVTSSNINYGALEFTEEATAGNAVNFSGRRLDISGAATAGGTTGRQRAGSSVLAPASTVATDARTITLGRVTVFDVLLGSNTLEVGEGYIVNVRDSGGAYLSAAGENLIGGGLIKTGPGSLTLGGPIWNPVTGQPSYNVLSGPTIVRGGILYLYNRLTNVTVESAGRLEGGGIIDGRLTNHGRIGSSVLTVNGDFVQSAGGTFAPYNSYVPGQSTIIGVIATGSATLAGTLSAYTHPNMFNNWEPGVVELQVLTAGSITGRFDIFDTSLNPARIHVEPLYSSTAVKLRFEMRPFAALGTTPAATAFGAYLDRVFSRTAGFFPNNYNWIGNALTFATDLDTIEQTMNDLSPDRYGTVLEHGFATALARRPTLDRITGGNEAAPVAAPRGALFAEGGRRRLTYAAVDGLARAETSTEGWLAGGHTRWGSWSAGAYVASDKTDLTQDDGGTSAHIRSVEPGAFLRFDHGAWFAHASASFSQDRYELSRIVNFTANSVVTSIHTAAPRGQRTDLSLTAGHTWHSGRWSLSPFIGLVSSRWEMDDFTETSDRPTFPFDSLAIEGWSHTAQRARAGLSAAGSWWNGRVQPRLAVSWWHESDDDRSIPTRLASGETTGYVAPGRPTDLATWQAALDINVRLRARAWFTLGGSVQRGDYSRTSSDVTAGFRWEF